MSTSSLIDRIMACRVFAVVGASRDSEKYGYKVYGALKRAGFKVYAVNPNADSIDGDQCYPNLDSIPEPVDCMVTVTPPEVTQEAIRGASHLRIPYLWMQPGSESNAAINLANASSMQVVANGPCIMVAAVTRRPQDSAPA